MKELADYKHILAVHPGALGDLVCAFPVLCRLSGGGARVDLLAESRLGRLAESLVSIGRHFPLESAKFASLYSDVSDPGVQSLVSGYDAIVCFSASEPLIRSFRRLTGAEIYSLPPKPPVHIDLHVTDYLMRELFSGTIFHTKSCRSMGRQADCRDGSILIHPGSGSRRKNWPFSNFMAAAKLFSEKGYRTEVVLGPAEAHMADAVRRAGVDFCIIDDLLSLADKLSAAAGFLGNDSGVSHMAAFIGLSVVAIFGPSDPRRWEPRGRRAFSIRGKVDCPPCFETHAVNCENPVCLTTVSPEIAVESLLNLDEAPVFL